MWLLEDSLDRIGLDTVWHAKAHFLFFPVSHRTNLQYVSSFLCFPLRFLSDPVVLLKLLYI